MDSKITTFLMFEGQAEEAMTFYTSLLDDSEILRIHKYSAECAQGIGYPEAEGTVQNGLFTLNGSQYMAFDSYGHNFTFTPAISMFVQCDSVDELKTLYDQLMEGGTADVSVVTYELTPRSDNKVLLRLTHRRLSDDPAVRVSVSAGWHTHLSILGDRLAGKNRNRSGKYMVKWKQSMNLL